LYLLGFNSVNFPWTITKDIPQNIIQDENFKKIEKLIDDNPQLLAWSKL